MRAEHQLRRATQIHQKIARGFGSSANRIAAERVGGFAYSLGSTKRPILRNLGLLPNGLVEAQARARSVDLLQPPDCICGDLGPEIALPTGWLRWK